MSTPAGQRPIMPRASFPPTPAPSTDITGKTSAHPGPLDTVQFALPPAAIGSARRSTTETSSSASNASDSSYRPWSPASPSASRKRPSSSQSVVINDDYSLPPPPTRSRKIIQMKPKESQEQSKTAPSPASAAKSAPAAGAAAGKRKQSGNTTAAGRKIARKTAHSLIERRRRSKMNEEFGVLKDMIPACAGQDMHKLTILQASIEYMRYLQQCVDDLKAAHRPRRASPTPASPRRERPPPAVATAAAEDEGEDGDGDDDEEEDEEDVQDEDMPDAVPPKHTAHAPRTASYQFANASPAIYPCDRSVYSTTTSPALRPGDVQNYSATMSPALQPSDPHHYSLSSSIRSTAASPAFGGQTPSQAQFQNPFPTAPSSKNSLSGPAGGGFALTSPALGPQADREDHEATEALLMLNTDRGSWHRSNGGQVGGRGMSVRDLLTG
ncbi:hypothetical protein PMIN04_000397 [Paraphaeosphaeria minitans]|uniref:Helix-loop-helix DNA-binding domain-containing protein n=1 Tax=Paraphaeosphaeria minitans TaxID=565426 RepID=A0A9P6KVX1_9PLEO|nr:helix-loop-helix DNA-binding domain-containing protein [Paraphaeosphaeria minitans]